VDEQSRGIHVHARTGLWNKTVFDPYVNMLRTTAEAFAAVVGGCDSLHVSPFDEVIRESDTFSRRIARNTHAILSEECGLSNVLDPAGGSWAVESLTDQMARKAWELFQGIEAEGGMLAVLQSGSWQQQVEAVRKKRAANIQQRRDVLVGTNQYPNATEQLLEAQRVDYAAAQAQRLADLQAARGKRDADKLTARLKAAAHADGSVSALVEAAAAGATLGELMGALDCGSPMKVERIAMQRAAQDYERLRLAAAATKSATLLQLNIGPSRRYRARADWTSAFFQVAGIEVLNENDFDNAEAALSALAESGVKAAIITSDDDTYAQQAVEVAARIKKAHPELYLLLAGAPGDTEAALKEAGVDDFVHVRVNNYQFNHALLGRLGAKL
jgi:methylmalonyl-CoA mutase